MINNSHLLIIYSSLPYPRQVANVHTGLIIFVTFHLSFKLAAKSASTRDKFDVTLLSVFVGEEKQGTK